MQLVDSHCHLDRIDLEMFDGDLSGALQAAQTLGVEEFLCVCIDLTNFETVKKIAEQFECVHATVGIHPTESLLSEPSVDTLVALGAHPKILAVGETGLDFYRLEGGDAASQLTRFRHHIRAARELNKPLVVHTRQARAETLQLLKEEKANEVGGVLHCFTEDWPMANQAMELGFYISFSGIVTFKNAVELQEIAKKIPIERMLVETDSPYLAPVPYRGKSNQPAYVRYVAEYIAKLRDEPLEWIAKHTTQNYRQLFRKIYA